MNPAHSEVNMTIKTHPAIAELPEKATRSWLTSLVGFLLLAEAIFLIILFPALIILRLWQLPDLSLDQIFPLSQTLQTFTLRIVSEPEPALLAHWATGDIQLSPGHAPALIYPILGMILIPVSIFFLRGKRYGWTLAVLIQGICLAVALATYFRYQPGYTYLLLFVCAILAFSLNFHGVKAAFFPAEILNASPDRELGS